jgi:hypothetical protein
MLIAITIPDARTEGVYMVCDSPRERSKKGEEAEMDGIDKMGNNRRTEIAPNNPSKPTAASGVTE